MPDGNLRSRLRNFVLELKRRKVIRASIAYVVVGAGVAEGAQLFLPALGAPEWVPKTVALIVVLGFPVAMALAWAFDIVPEPEVANDTDDRASNADSVAASSSFRSASKL